ncbi:MAG: hypothetical protein IKN49_04250 [Elusimicrobiaceae bacterium]|nr:hypothetical protein [Elusimicrobiaceae bacterium]
MRKNLLFVSLFLAAAIGAQADGLKFVTTLSQPVGVFQNIEAVDANATSNIYSVNFCRDTVARGGSISSKKATVVTDLLLTKPSSVLSSADGVDNLVVKSFQLKGSDLNTDALQTSIPSVKAKSLQAQNIALTTTSLIPEKGVKIWVKDTILQRAFPNNSSHNMSTVVASMNAKMNIPNVAVYSTGPESANLASNMRWHSIACATGETSCNSTNASKTRILLGDKN